MAKTTHADETFLIEATTTPKKTRSRGKAKEKKMEEKYKDLNWILEERMKELRCVYGIGELVESDKTIDEVIEGVVQLLPPAWQYSEVTCARIILGKQKFKTKRFKETRWKQSADFKVQGKKAGTVEVYYLEERPQSYEGPFLKEERELIVSIAERLGRTIERKKGEEAVNKLANYLRGVQTPVVAIDRNFNVVYINDNGAGFLGLTPDEVLGKKCYDFFKTDDCRTPKCALAIAMKTKKEATSRTVSRARKGEVPIQYVGSPIFDETGEIIGATEFIIDVTELNNLITTTTNIIKSSTDVSKVVEDLSEQILKTAGNVGTMGIQAAQASDTLTTGMQQVQSSAQNVASGAQNLTQIAQDTAKNIQNLTTQMDDIDKATREVNKLVTTSNKLSQEVSEGSNQALKALDEIKNTASRVEKTIDGVNSSVKNVAGLAGDISQIAGQVNMLALNAAIEAARAGEAGRGFAVVADAVKQLAGQAGTAAKTSVESIDEITKAADRAAMLSKSAGQVAKKGDSVVSKAVSGSQQVASSMEKILGVTQNLAAIVQASKKSIGETNATIQQVASFSEESASASEETSASIEEQTAATEQVAAISKKLQEEGTNATKLSQKIVEEVKNLRNELAKVELSK